MNIRTVTNTFNTFDQNSKDLDNHLDCIRDVKQRYWTDVEQGRTLANPFIPYPGWIEITELEYDLAQAELKRANLIITGEAQQEKK